MAQNLHIEAKRRKMEADLEPLLRKTLLHSFLIDLIDDVSAAGQSKNFKNLSSIARNTWERSRPLWTGVEDDPAMLEHVIRSRAGAYASCMAVAATDTAYCEAASFISDDNRESCHMVYSLFALIAGEAIREGGSCGSVMKKCRILPYEEAVDFCNAIVENKSQLCPWPETSPPGIFCRAAIARGSSNICESMDLDEETSMISCCEQFEWRFASALGKGATPYVIPELGALAGDEEGCMRALKWGLFHDLAELFGVEDLPETAKDHSNKYSEYICPLIIHWSQRETPL